MELNQVTIPCRDYDASVAFYRALGLRQIVDSPPRYARFETAGGTTLSLHAADAVLANTGFVVYFEVEDVDAAVKMLTEAGLDFDGPPRDERWLWREARLRDPAGNVVCIYNAGEYRRFPPWRLEDAD